MACEASREAPSLSLGVSLINVKWKSCVRTFADTDMEVWKDHSGFDHLRCRCDINQRKEWCNHIAEWMDKERDASTLGPVPAVIVFKPPQSLIIPCTALTVQGKNIAAVQAVWGDVTVGGGGQLRAGGAYNIGYITPNKAGRGHLRKMLLDWLTSIPYQFPDRLECTASTHMPGSCVFDEESQQTLGKLTPREVNRAVILDAYQLLDNSMCRQCAETNWTDWENPF